MGRAHESRRGSPEVVEKRRAARLFNDIVLGRKPSPGDGRIERRRRRLLEELAAGVARGGKRELTPIDVLTRVQALLDLGEPLASIRRARPTPTPLEPTDELVDGVRRIHEAYGFQPAVYAFVGLGGGVLRRAGVAGAGPRRASARALRAEPRPGVARAGSERIGHVGPAVVPARRRRAGGAA